MSSAGYVWAGAVVLVVAVVSLARVLKARRVIDHACAAAQRAGAALDASDALVEDGEPAQGRMLDAVSHHFRTRLAVVKASAESLRLLGTACSREQALALLETMEDSTNLLEDLLANLVDVSRLRAGELVPVRRSVSVEELVDRALGATTQASRVVVLPMPEVPPVFVDPRLASRALHILIDNALRYSPDPSQVAITAAVFGGRVTCAVVDHGPGMNDQTWDQQQRSAPVWPLDDRHAGGPGLGLAVARGLTEVMGGQLQRSATPGGGLTVRLIFPTRPHVDQMT